jgi:phthalate 4,5-dioxygenase oxygenase subunit
MLNETTNTLLTSTGSGTPVGVLFRNYWVPVLMSDELPERDGTPVRVQVMGEELLLFRDTDGQVGLVDAYCAHRGSPLFYGRNEACGIRCIYHGWKFDVHGRCVDMPNEPPTSRFKDKVSITAYPTREAGGLVWAYMGSSEELPAPPELEWLGLEPSQVDIWKYRADCNYLQAIEGDHDSSHITMLHGSLDGLFNPDGSIRNEMERGSYWADPAPKLQVLETPYGMLTGSRRNGSPETYYWRISAWLLPWYNMIASDPGTPMHLNAVVPIDDNSCWIYKVIWMPDRPMSDEERQRMRSVNDIALEEDTLRLRANWETDYLQDRTVQKTQNFSGIETFVAQDRAVTERMRPATPVDRGIVDRSQEHLTSSDASIILLRRKLLKTLKAFQAGAEPETVRDGSLYRIRTPIVELPRSAAFDVGISTYIGANSWLTTRGEYAVKVGAAK